MATTKLWKIHTRLDHVVDYVTNAEKTLNPDMDTDITAPIQAVIAYAGESDKTTQPYLVSGLNCSPETAYAAMRLAFAKNDKPLRVLGYHGYQSFAQGEVSAQAAHEIGMKLAQEMWGERFQVVVATHLNTGHFHNHFVVCSTSFKDGKRYNYCGKERKRMMAVSDALCRAHSLSVVETPYTKQAVSYAEWQAEQNHQPTKRSLVRADIDAALTITWTTKQFIRIMEQRGYVLDFSRKHCTIKPANAKRAFRFDSLGSGYTVEDIRSRIAGNYRAAASAPPRKQAPIIRSYRYKGAWKSKFNKSGVCGLRALYYHYCYLLGVFPHKPQNSKRMYALLHEDIIRMDKTIQATRLLFAHHIDTQEQLLAYMAQNTQIEHTLTVTRQHLRRSLRKETAPEKQDALKRQISAATAQLKRLRAEQKICEDVSRRSEQVKTNTCLIRQARTTEKGKENEHESRRRCR